MRPYRFAVPFCLAVALLCLAVEFLGQTPAAPPATPPPDPVLRVETRLVAINVIAKDNKGQPVDDLTKADFTLRDNGEPREIAVFSLERMTGSTPAPPPVPGVLSNRVDQQARAATIVLFDGLNTAVSDQMYARQELLKFLRQMQPDQRVALYALGNTLRILHEFTSDPAELLRAAKGSVQQANHTPDPDAAPSVDQALDDLTRQFSEYQNIDRARTTISALSAIAQHVSRLPGRKNLVWISGGFPIFIGLGLNNGLTVGPTESFADDVARLTKTLNDANLAVYPVDARGLVAPGGAGRARPVAWPQPPARPAFLQNIAFYPAPPGNTGGGGSGGGAHTAPTVPRAPRPTSSATSTRPANASSPLQPGYDDGYETMALIAEKTGGLAFHNRNDLAAAIGAAVDDARVSYALGFYVPAAALDGKYHNLKVSVDRSGVKLRHRLGYDATPFTAAPAPMPLTEIIRLPLPSTDVGLSVSLQKAASGGQAARINIDTHNLTLVEKDGKWVGQAEMLVVTGQGSAQAGSTLVNLKFSEDQYQKVVKEGITLIKHLELRPGQNDIRIAFRDKPSGATGSLYMSVTMASAAAPVTPPHAPPPAAEKPAPPPE